MGEIPTEMLFFLILGQRTVSDGIMMMKRPRINFLKALLSICRKRSFVQARNYCRKTQSVIFNPGENYILEFIAATINSNPAVDPEERVWVSSCQTLTANINQSLDVHEDDCDGIWHFICERVVDK